MSKLTSLKASQSYGSMAAELMINAGLNGYKKQECKKK